MECFSFTNQPSIQQNKLHIQIRHGLIFDTLILRIGHTTICEMNRYRQKNAQFIIESTQLPIRFIKEEDLMICRNITKRKSVETNAYADRRTLVQTLNAIAETSPSTIVLNHRPIIMSRKDAKI